MRLLWSLTVIVVSGAACLPALAGPASKEVATQVEAAAAAHLGEVANKANWLEPQWTLTVLDNTPVRRGEAPLACSQALAVEAVDTRHVSRMRFTARCPVEGGWVRDVVVRAQVSAKVVVMAQDVAAGQAIKDDDLQLERRDVTLVPDAVSDTQVAVGFTGSRSLRAGQVLSRRALLTPVLVMRGHTVSIVARNQGIAVTVAGEALDAGREGEIVRVRNIASGKVIRARVIDMGKVEPESMAVSAPAQSRE